MSQFLKQADLNYSEDPKEIDFERAVKLYARGSTCDVFRTRWQRRDVFVKRLKDEFRHKPIYLDALDKEFDVGASLQHPSLPEYREFHREYIVIDYIDGITLAEMIRLNDPWLRNENNILKILNQLIDVVDYLHRRNVVHCDIKPDNLIITNNGRNLVLIDFDKSYTDALSDTSGHPAKYGLTENEKGRTILDFRGIGMVVERLHSGISDFKFSRYKQFVRASNNCDVNAEVLKAILAYTPSSASLVKLLLGSVAICTLLSIIIYVYNRNFTLQNTDNVITGLETIPVYDLSDTAAKSLPDTSSSSNIAPAVMLKRESTDKGAFEYKTPQELLEIAKEKAALLDKVITPQFDELQASLDYLQALKNDTTLTGQELLDAIRKQGELEDEYIIEAVIRAREMFNLTTNNVIDERELARILSFSKAYTGYKRRYAREGQEFRLEYERRFRKESKDPVME